MPIIMHHIYNIFSTTYSRLRNFQLPKVEIRNYIPLFLLFALSLSSNLSAADYAANSVLAEGTWKKVKVSTTGMQFISNADLRSMGFSNPEKVNVYGFGGRQIQETLTSSEPDDLPILPVVRTSNGIHFFGFNHIRWDRSTSSSDLSFSHTLQAYAEESWYFLSDRDADPFEMTAAENPENATESLESFTQMLLHEQDLTHPSTSGRVYLGEDFRSPNTRIFNFDLTDLTDGSARAKISFGCKTSGTAALTFTANGTQLSATSADNIPAVTSSDQFMTLRTTVKTIQNPQEKLALGITFQNSGTITLAKLDFIEIEYPRAFIMRNGELYFNTKAQSPASITLQGAESATIIWDITDPQNPQEVSYTLSGSNAIFNVPAGSREYIAFTPDKCGSSVSSPTSVANQNLHSLPIPDMLIITPSQYLSAANTLAAHHKSYDDLEVCVLTPEDIYNEFSSGTPDVSAFRKLLKMWYDRGVALDALTDTQNDGDDSADSSDRRIKYCLIMSRPTYDNKGLMTTTQEAGYPRVPIWQSLSGNSKNTSYSTDDFIGMLLESNTSSFAIGSAKMQVSVGRMPVTSASQATEMVDKYINYVTTSDFGNWRNYVMLIADDQDSGIHLKQTQEAYSNMIDTDAGSKFLYERLYLDNYEMQSGATGFSYPDAKSRMLRIWKDGVSFINYIGHAYLTGWGHEDLLNYTDINDLTNSRFPFLYAATCEFARYDEDSLSGAEILWSKTDGGIIATICPARTVFITQNGTLTKQMSQNFFKTDDSGAGMRIGDIFINSKNAVSGSDDNKLRYALIGNPAMRIQLPKYQVAIESINDIDPAEAEDKPVLQARGKAEIKGRILNADGNYADDFNGQLDIILYDAEKVVQTNGNGDDGVVIYYNDRKTQLYHGLTRVVNGEWSTTVMLPSEIDNNYTPARFTFYAYSDAGIEAHGETTDLYVYGYNADADDDMEGPDIKVFALNREDFENGGVVNSTPVVIARVSDPSGINLSDAGIGHKITLILDGNKYFEDVNSYYSPDPDEASDGSILYPLSELEAGDHNLQLTVWDNANNSSTASLDFVVAVAKAPEIYELTTDVNPARDKVNFILTTDQPMSKLTCLIEVFDLNGRRVWSSESSTSADILASITKSWDLKDTAGVRVPRGIYLYRATITTEAGTSATRTKKLAVTAQ